MYSLAEKTILVTGAARGIGLAIATSCAHAGARVVVADHDGGAADAAAAGLHSQGREALAMQVDVSSRNSVEAMVGMVLQQWGQIDGLVNNAGVVDDAQLRNLTDSQWERVIGVNLRGPFLCTQAVSAHFLARSKGSIVNISSVVALHGNFGQTNYVAAKAGLIGMSKTWARELGRKNIRSNVICPGFIQTAITQGMPQKVIDGMLAAVPLGRAGQPEEIGKVAAFLCSDDAGYVNGAVIEVTGGLML